MRTRSGRAFTWREQRSIYYMVEPAPHEFILWVSAIGERAIREALKRLAR